jgi:perosamine synthetase
MYSKFTDILSFIRDQYLGKKTIALHEPVFAGNEKKYLLDCIDSTLVSSIGPYVDKFEALVKEYTDAGFAVAAVNGTAALHLALKLAGVRQRDFVLTQPLTFVATCNAIFYCGAESIFIDIDKKNLGMSADKLEQWLADNTEIVTERDTDSGFKCVEKTSRRKISACVPMHTFGHPCEIDRIADICKAYNIALIEDAAESLGSRYKNRHTGNFGLLGIFSFNGNKTITSGGGGMIITGDEKLAILAKHLTTQARVNHPWKMEHDSIGHNYRMPNLNAALGCAQMERLDDMIRSKRYMAAKYEAFFKQLGIGFITEPADSCSNYWLNAILFENEQERDSFLQYSHDNCVLSRPCWTLMHRLPMFSNCLHSDLSVAENIEARLVNIPSGAIL